MNAQQKDEEYQSAVIVRSTLAKAVQRDPSNMGLRARYYEALTAESFRAQDLYRAIGENIEQLEAA